MKPGPKKAIASAVFAAGAIASVYGGHEIVEGFAALGDAEKAADAGLFEEANKILDSVELNGLKFVGGAGGGLIAMNGAASVLRPGTNDRQGRERSKDEFTNGK
jgi:hypothetical protein